MRVEALLSVAHSHGLLGGSWVVISGVISWVTLVIALIKGNL